MFSMLYTYVEKIGETGDEATIILLYHMQPHAYNIIGNNTFLVRCQVYGSLKGLIEDWFN